MSALFHITTQAAWVEARTGGEYRAPSLETQGFIHLSTEVQWPLTLKRFFAGQRHLVLLVIDPAKLHAQVRFEPAHADSFPHLFGPLNLEAVVEVRAQTSLRFSKDENPQSI